MNIDEPGHSSPGSTIITYFVNIIPFDVLQEVLDRFYIVFLLLLDHFTKLKTYRLCNRAGMHFTHIDIDNGGFP